LKNDFHFVKEEKVLVRKKSESSLNFKMSNKMHLKYLNFIHTIEMYPAMKHSKINQI